MGTSVIRGDFFRVISDGEKIVLLRGTGKQRECYLYNQPLLTTFSSKTNWPRHEVQSWGGDSHYIAGNPDHSIDLSFRCRDVLLIEHPLVMGVDIFDQLSVTDYLDIINEKIKGR